MLKRNCNPSTQTGFLVDTMSALNAASSDNDDDQKHENLSKNQQKKIARHERVLENNKAKRKSEQERAREKYKLLRQQGGPSKEEIRTQQLARLKEAVGTGIKVCLDFQFEGMMIEKELTHLVNQAKRVYSSNKSATHPFDLHFLNLHKNSKTYQMCCDKNTGFENYLVTMSNCGATELFEAESIVYLTPDSDTVLEELYHDHVYVIGGLVDDSVKKNTSHLYCEAASLKTARLPIPELMSRSEKGGSFKQILTINQVFDILLHFHQERDWKSALNKHVPAKTGFVVK